MNKTIHVIFNTTIETPTGINTIEETLIFKESEYSMAESNVLTIYSNGDRIASFNQWNRVILL